MSILLRAPRATLSLRDNARNCGICRTSTHLPDEERRGGLVCGWVSVSSRPTVPLFLGGSSGKVASKAGKYRKMLARAHFICIKL